jgi:ATP phosphoribosyltransferase
MTASFAYAGALGARALLPAASRGAPLDARPAGRAAAPRAVVSRRWSRAVVVASAAAAASAAGGSERRKIRVAIPSKGGMFEETRRLLGEIGANVVIQNPRQYVAALAGLDAELWLQRPPDIVRKVRDGDVDLGFVGGDLVAEYGGADGEKIVTVHEDLCYGGCRLAVGVPMSWDGVGSVADLRAMAGRPGCQPLRVATKFHNCARAFMARHSIDNYRLVNMDGALEASTQMGTADCIVDLVSSGVTLRENLLKEIDAGTILDSTMQLVGNRAHLAERSEFGDALRLLTRELLERTEAHLLGRENFNVIANIRGSSMVDVSRKLGGQTELRGVDGPTISHVVPPADFESGMYAISIVLPKAKVYSAVRQLRTVGGSGVTVLPVTYIFEEENRRWQALLAEVGLESARTVTAAADSAVAKVAGTGA